MNYNISASLLFCNSFHISSHHNSLIIGVNIFCYELLMNNDSIPTGQLFRSIEMGYLVDMVQMHETYV